MKDFVSGIEEIKEFAEVLDRFKNDEELKSTVLESVEVGRDAWSPGLSSFNAQIFLDGELLGLVKSIHFIKDYTPDSWTKILIERYLFDGAESIETMITNNSKIEVRYIRDEEIYAEQSATKLRKSKLIRTVDADLAIPLERIELITKNEKFEYVK